MDPMTSEWLLPRMLARLSDDGVPETGRDGPGNAAAPASPAHRVAAADRVALIELIEHRADADLVRDMLALAARRATAPDHPDHRPQA